jgi:hypothetical protein
MPAHKFKIGETVFIRPAPSQNLPGGTYVVIQRLPEHDGELEYRVRSRAEPHERVIRESQLRAGPSRPSLFSKKLEPRKRQRDL